MTCSGTRPLVCDSFDPFREERASRTAASLATGRPAPTGTERGWRGLASCVGAWHAFRKTSSWVEVAQRPRNRSPALQTRTSFPRVHLSGPGGVLRGVLGPLGAPQRDKEPVRPTPDSPLRLTEPHVVIWGPERMIFLPPGAPHNQCGAASCLLPQKTRTRVQP